MIDTHVHLWNPAKLRLRWIDGDALWDKRFDLEEYREATRGLPIEAMVYAEVDVAPQYALIEALAFEDRVKREPRLAGLIAHAPVEDGEPLRTYLAALLAASPHVKGVRRLLQGEREPGFCLRPRFIRGAQILGELGLSFDICITHTQLRDAIELAARCPGTSFVLDHIAKPNIAAGLLDPWRADLANLAALPNVTGCKISGMVNEADNAHWKVEDLQPYFDHVLASFGERRVMFGGDWPVVLKAAEYARWVGAVDSMVRRAGLSAGAERALFADNARRVYRL